MDEQRLREVEERAAKATPGPWRVGSFGQIYCSDPEIGGYYVATVYPLLTPDALKEDREATSANEQFIAEARTDVPDLVAALQEAWGYNKLMEKEIEFLRSQDLQRLPVAKLNREIATVLGTTDPVEAVEKIKRMQEMLDKLRAYVAELRGNRGD